MSFKQNPKLTEEKLQELKEQSEKALQEFDETAKAYFTAYLQHEANVKLFNHSGKIFTDEEKEKNTKAYGDSFDQRKKTNKEHQEAAVEMSTKARLILDELMKRNADDKTTEQWGDRYRAIYTYAREIKKRIYYYAPDKIEEESPAKKSRNA